MHVAYNGYAIAGTLDFTVNVGIDCSSATFDAFTVRDMTFSVFGTPDTQTLPTIHDSVSKIAGNNDGFTHCGSRQWAITTTPTSYYSNYLSLDTSTDVLTLGLTGTTHSDVNSYTIEVTTSLTSYPGVTASATFTATVTDCVVTALSMTAVTAQSYNVYTPSITFSHVDFIQTPACGYTLDYTYQIKAAGPTYSALPAGLITESSKTFTVSSTDPTDVGSYDISVIGAVPSGYPAYQDELIISLTVSNGCQSDQITATGAAISDFTYYIAEDGTINFTPTWSGNTVAGCPWTYEV